jgi:uncharacterized membrane protein YdbT with pleckstrin-like domain
MSEGIMGKYVERSLYENELIVEKAQRDKWELIGSWVLVTMWLCAVAVLLFFWFDKKNMIFLIGSGIIAFFLLFALISAIKKSIIFDCTELVLTNKRIIRKSGVFHTKAFDVPLNKIQNVYVETTFWGRVFNTNKIRITTTIGIIVDKLENADDFKSTILGQIDHLDEARLARQAMWTAQAMAQNEKPKKKVQPQRRGSYYDED